MSLWGGAFAAAALLWAPAVIAAPADAAPAPNPPAAAQGAVSSYPPAFFSAIRPNTALDMVNALPGFTLDTGSAVRGFGGAAGNVLIDSDRPATKNDTLDAILQRIPASSVERIDVIRGGAPGIDMQGKAVIANVIRKPDAGLKLTTVLQSVFLANGIVDPTARIDASRRIGRLSLEGSLQLAKGADDGTGDGPHLIRGPDGRVTQADLEHYFGWADIDKATASVETPLGRGTLRLEGSLLINPYWSRNHDLSPAPVAQQTELFFQGQNTAEVGARYVRRFGAATSLEVYGLQQLSDFDERDNLATPFDRTLFSLSKRQGESILRATLTTEFGRRITVRSGLEGDYNWLLSRTAETDHGAAVFVPAANVQVNELRGEAYSDLTWQARPDLVIEAGLHVEGSRLASRGDVAGNASFVFPKPRLVLSWTPTPHRQLELRIEREVAQLDFGNFAAQGSLEQGEHAGNPHLVPQQDWVVETTFDRRFWSGGDASMTFREFWLQDVIDFAPLCQTCGAGGEFDAPANIGAGEQRALIAALTLPTDKLGIKNGQLILRATWRYSRVTDPSTHAGREISGLHAFDGEAHFTQGLPGLKSTWGFDVVAPWRQAEYHFNEVDIQKLGGWLDIWFEYKPRPDISVRLEGDNLTSHGLEQIRQFFDPFRDDGGGLLTSIDDRNPRFGQELTLRVRKTFG